MASIYAQLGDEPGVQSLLPQVDDAEVKVRLLGMLHAHNPASHAGDLFNELVTKSRESTDAPPVNRRELLQLYLSPTQYREAIREVDAAAAVRLSLADRSLDSTLDALDLLLDFAPYFSKDFPRAEMSQLAASAQAHELGAGCIFAAFAGDLETVANELTKEGNYLSNQPYWAVPFAIRGEVEALERLMALHDSANGALIAAKWLAAHHLLNHNHLEAARRITYSINASDFPALVDASQPAMVLSITRHGRAWRGLQTGGQHTFIYHVADLPLWHLLGRLDEEQFAKDLIGQLSRPSASQFDEALPWLRYADGLLADTLPR